MIEIDWPAPAHVRTLCTTRGGGVSQGAWGLSDGRPGGLNLGLHVGDNPSHVQVNRARVQARVGRAILWMEQVHGTQVCDADDGMAERVDAEGGAVSQRVGWPSDRHVPMADAAISSRADRALCIMTADCLPVLFSDRQGRCIGAAHAGWRGLLDGVLEATVQAMRARMGAGAPLLAWLGPVIGPQAFEVGDEVRAAFVAQDHVAAAAFKPASHPGKWFGDLEWLARQRLAACGDLSVYGGGLCTVSDPDRFYSHRRDRVSGRMASLVWLAR